MHRRAFLVGVLAAAAAPTRAESPPDPFLALGVERPRELKAAPPFTLPDLEGRPVTVPRDFRGRAVLVSFFTTT